MRILDVGYAFFNIENVTSTRPYFDSQRDSSEFQKGWSFRIVKL